MQTYRRMKSSEGRGRRDQCCDSGHLICGAHLRQLFPRSPFLVTVMSCFESPLVEPPVNTAGTRAEGSLDLLHPCLVSSAVPGDFITLGLALIHGGGFIYN